MISGYIISKLRTKFVKIKVKLEKKRQSFLSGVHKFERLKLVETYEVSIPVIASEHCTEL